MDMKRDWLEFARRLAAGARAKLAEDRRRVDANQTGVSPQKPQSGTPAAAR
jgi:hypothetical protein